MTLNFIKKSAFTALLLVFTTAPAWAGGKIVFDPTNFSKNVITAAQTAKTTAIVANQYATQIRQFQLQLQNVKQLDPQAVEWAVQRGYLPTEAGGGAMTAREAISAAQGVYLGVREFSDHVGAMVNVYSDINAWNNDVLRQSYSAGVSADALIDYEARALEAGRKTQATNLTQLSNLTGQLKNHQARADQLAKQIPNIKGNVQGFQTLSAQNYLISDQLAAITQAATSGAASTGVSESDRLRDRARSDAISAAAEERNRKLQEGFSAQSGKGDRNGK